MAPRHLLFVRSRMRRPAAPASVRLSPLLAGLLAAGAPAAWAEALPAERTLSKVVVSATRVETAEEDVPAVVSVITAEEIARDQANNVKDLLRHEPGVSVRSQPNRSSAAFYATGRGGNEGINIRGLEGNQVMLQVDGVRLPMGYYSGPVAAGRADYIDVEAFKRVELLRGPSSTSYGSDGLSGAVSFVTKDPSDLLTLGKPVQGAVKLGYASADRSWSLVPSYAVRGERVQAMVLASLRRGHATETMGTHDAPDRTRTTPNPQATRSDYLLGKLVFDIDAQHRVKLSAENLDRRVDSEVYTLFGDPMYPTTTAVTSNEHIQRSLLRADYEYTDRSNPWFQRARAGVYWQDAENRQVGREARTNTTGWNTRVRDNPYAEQSLGASVQFESQFGRDLVHRLVYGLDVSDAEITALKGGGNFLNGALVTTGSSAFHTNKSFPDTDYRLVGAFVQDEISAGRLSVVPGLRLDHFALTPRDGDPLYTMNNAQPPVALSGTEASPKLGVIWTQAPMLRFFGQYAHGFRAPTPTQVNGGVTNLTASIPYKTIGNANLKPESSDSLELGVRGASDTASYRVSVYRSRYKNFISANEQVGGSGTAADPTVYQSINLNGVTIQGFELSGAWIFRPNWTLLASYAHAKGDSEQAGVKTPLSTIDPDKLVLGLRYEQRERFGGELTLTAVERQQRNPDPAMHTAAGFALVDLTAWFQISRQLSLNLGLFNVFDRKVHLWADTRDVAATSAIVDAFSQPGRNASVSLRYQF